MILIFSIPYWTHWRLVTASLSLIMARHCLGPSADDSALKMTNLREREREGGREGGREGFGGWKNTK